MTLSPADREWIRRILKRQEERLREHFDAAIREEAQLAVLHAMTRDESPRPVA